MCSFKFKIPNLESDLCVYFFWIHYYLLNLICILFFFCSQNTGIIFFLIFLALISISIFIYILGIYISIALKIQNTWYLLNNFFCIYFYWTFHDKVKGRTQNQLIKNCHNRINNNLNKSFQVIDMKTLYIHVNLLTFKILYI